MDSSPRIPVHLNTEQDTNMVFNNQDVENVATLRNIDEEAQREKSSETAQAQKRRKHKQPQEPRSIHWNNYTKVWVKVGDPPIEKLKGKCKHCGTLIAADSRIGTNGLRNHTIVCLKRLATLQPGESQTVLNYTVDHTGGIPSLTSWKFDQKTIRLSLCEMIIIGELPFLFVEYPCFKRYAKQLSSIPHSKEKQ